MIGRIVEVADDRRHLFLHRGFMVVQDTVGERKELGQIPLDDIAAVIANAHGLSYTNNLLVALAERGAPFVLCAANHNAVGMLLPLDGNFEQSRRIEAQIAASLPTHKRLWAAVVRAKLEQQAAALEAAGSPTAPLTALCARSRVATPKTWKPKAPGATGVLLFGQNFRRDQDGDGLNALLNYGYTVLRSATARAVIAAGLHPGIGLHHSNDNNAMRLVDDLMEPFRPVVDLKVWQLWRNGELHVTPETKRALVRTLYDDMQTDMGATPVMVCMQKLATSLHRSIWASATNSICLCPVCRWRWPAGFERRMKTQATMLTGYRLMWMVVMFDLPVVLKAERKAATEFRNALLDMGFEMSQFSVYMRFCTSRRRWIPIASTSNRPLPAGGKVHICNSPTSSTSASSASTDKPSSPPIKRLTSSTFLTMPLFSDCQKTKNPSDESRGSLRAILDDWDLRSGRNFRKLSARCHAEHSRRLGFALWPERGTGRTATLSTF
jgi:CRISPR-associated protein Cas1